MTDELLIKYLLQETTVSEQENVEKWLTLDAANREHFLSFRKIWEASKGLAIQSTVDEQEAWTKFRAKADQRQHTPVKRKLFSYRWTKIAAAIALVAGLWFTYEYSRRDIGYVTLEASNNIQSDTLPDGTILTLNKGASLRYAGNFQNKRTVMMESGDVFFDVAKDKSHPFVITVNQITVTVVGTSFNIKHLPGHTEINVESGIVEVRRGNEILKMQKGDHLSIADDNSGLRKKHNTDQLYNYYQSKLFIARNTPLPKLVATLNEAYNSNIVLAPGLDHLTFNSTLRTGNLTDNLTVICETLNLRQSDNGQRILLSNKKP